MVSVLPIAFGVLAIVVFYVCFYCAVYIYIHFIRGTRVTQTGDSYLCPRCKHRLAEATSNCPECNEKLLFA